MSEKNRKFEVTMHGRIRKTPVRKKKNDAEQPKTASIPGFESITPEMLQTLIQLFEAQRHYQPPAPVMPSFPQFPSMPSPYEYPLTIPAVWYADPGLQWSNGTGILNNGINRNGLSLTGDAIAGSSFTVSASSGDISSVVQAQNVSGTIQNMGETQGSSDQITLTSQAVVEHGHRPTNNEAINFLQKYH